MKTMTKRAKEESLVGTMIQTQLMLNELVFDKETKAAKHYSIGSIKIIVPKTIVNKLI